jgi:hypothetical protein
MLGARSDNQIVEWNLEIRKLDNFSSEIEAYNFVHNYFDILAAAKNPADGRGNFSGRNSGRGDLIKERLKCVVVPAIDEGDSHRQLREIAGCLEPTKSGANHYYARVIFVHADSC